MTFEENIYIGQFKKSTGKSEKQESRKHLYRKSIARISGRLQRAALPDGFHKNKRAYTSPHKARSHQDIFPKYLLTKEIPIQEIPSLFSVIIQGVRGF
mgnify:CR=1 FL=1